MIHTLTWGKHRESKVMAVLMRWMPAGLGEVLWMFFHHLPFLLCFQVIDEQLHGTQQELKLLGGWFLMMLGGGEGRMNTEVLSCFPHLAVTADLLLKVETKGTVQNMVYYKKKLNSTFSSALSHVTLRPHHGSLMGSPTAGPCLLGEFPQIRGSVLDVVPK